MTIQLITLHYTTALSHKLGGLVADLLNLSELITDFDSRDKDNSHS